MRCSRHDYSCDLGAAVTVQTSCVHALSHLVATENTSAWLASVGSLWEFREPCRSFRTLMGLSACTNYGCRDHCSSIYELFYHPTLKIIFWNCKALFWGWLWPSGWKPVSPQAVKTQLGKGKSANHRHRLDIFIHAGSFRNCSFHPRPTVLHHAVFLIMEPQVSLFVLEAFYSDLLFSLVLKSAELTRAHAWLQPGKNAN